MTAPHWTIAIFSHSLGRYRVVGRRATRPLARVLRDELKRQGHEVRVARHKTKEQTPCT